MNHAIAFFLTDFNCMILGKTNTEWRQIKASAVFIQNTKKFRPVLFDTIFSKLIRLVHKTDTCPLFRQMNYLSIRFQEFGFYETLHGPFFIIGCRNILNAFTKKLLTKKWHDHSATAHF
ncbi:hypothetical protein RF11_06609 [Thelohanellus kitauei]|uniref:Uncharacterized protein n=1 Tax=Thelohanellus kitauei TaxID=669202 RepID=A0A0C2MCB3_THEKT|nr:hypothetical protein RF11_06609 [Thelohanellus kitauei]